MSNRPNPIWHMIQRGVSNGFILTMIYGVIFLIIGIIIDPPLVETYKIFIYGIYTLVIAAIMLGVIPGAMMGVIVGLCLRQLIGNVSFPFRKSDMKRIRVPIYGIVFWLTLVLYSLLIYFIWSSTRSYVRHIDPWAVPFFTIFPPIIAAFASTYAAHRYLINLHEWSKQVDVRKSKAKNDDFQHLTDENAASDYQLNVDDSAHYQERRQ